MLRRFPVLFSLLVFSNLTWSQMHKKYQEVGDKLMEKGDYAGAAKNYHLGLKQDSSDASLRFAYAQSLRLTNNYKKAAFYYESVRKHDKERKYLESMHYAGEMYKYLGNYKKSLKEHTRYAKRYRGDKNKYEYLKSKHEVDNSLKLIHLMKDTVDLYLDNDHPVNTAYSEFGAYIENDTMLMYSTLTSDSLKNRLVLDSNTYFARIHLAEFNSKWEGKGPHPVFHEEEEMHIANATYSPDREYVFYSECSDGKCQIIRALNNNGEWSEFEVLPDKINLPGFTSTQPYLARVDGYDLLFFSSDRPNGHGKLDIWYTIAYSNGLYEDPINLGDSINSPGNDICPFYFDAERALYFSSDWHYGLGGFDIFRCINLGKKYSKAENLGLPFNSSYNDLYFRNFGKQAVLTSNREGSLTDQYENCCNDLFFFEYEAKTIIPEVEMSYLDRIEKLLPLRLFFHNDEPNPRSTDTTTSILYSASYLNYIGKIATYEREYSRGLKGLDKEEAQEEINHFFQSEVKLGYSDLKEACNLILNELERGTELELVIKGYASPLSRSDYNKRLTLRRISSVKNELEFFQSGALVKYLESGQLKINSIPFGEDRLSARVSDDLNDKRNAIYSKKASFERRVEILSVRKITP